jgi:hypothetical protein
MPLIRNKYGKGRVTYSCRPTSPMARSNAPWEEGESLRLSLQSGY